MPSPTSTIEVDEIVRSGNLYKEGVSRLKWNTRYFELLKHRIVYYDHEGSDTVRGEATLYGYSCSRLGAHQMLAMARSCSSRKPCRRCVAAQTIASCKRKEL